MRFLLATNIVSGLGQRCPDSKGLNWIAAHEDQAAIPAVVVAERYQGAHAAAPERRVKLLAEIDWFCSQKADAILPFDSTAAKIWGEYVTRPSIKAKSLGYADTQIAAIALANDLTLVTRNVADFPEVECFNPLGLCS